MTGQFRLRFDKLSGRITPAYSQVFLVVPGNPFALRILVAPDGARPGFPLDTQPRIGAEDKAGNFLPDFGTVNRIKSNATNATQALESEDPHRSSRQWTITAELLFRGVSQARPLSPSLPTRCRPKPDGVLCSQVGLGQAAAPVINGQAEFHDLQVNLSGTDLTIRFSSLDGSLIPVISAPFAVEDGPPATLAVLEQPGGAIVAAAFTFQPSVLILDRGGNRVTAVSSSVSASDSRSAVHVRLDVLEVIPTSPSQTSNTANTSAAFTRTATGGRPVLVALGGNNGSAPVNRGLAQFQSLSVSGPGMF